jgi:hypothetical protein
MPNPTLGEFRDETLHGTDAKLINFHEALSSHAIDALRPAGVVAEAFPRSVVSGANVAAAASGTLTLTAVPLAAGQTVSSITFISATTAGVALLNQWFALYDSARKLWAVTSDDTSTAWAANTAKTLNIATVSATPGGTQAAATSFVVPYNGLWYVGFMVAVTTTVPTAVSLVQNNAAINAVVPILGGTADTGLTTPSTAPATAAAITATADRKYALLK